MEKIHSSERLIVLYTTGMNNVPFRASDYVFTPGDAIHFGREFWGTVRRLGGRDILGIALVSAVVFALRVYAGFGPEALFFWAFALSIFYWRWDARLPIGAALGCLAAIPLLLVLYNQNIVYSGEDWAERVAVWAYYFLVMGVGKQIVDVHAARRTADADSDDSIRAGTEPEPPLRKRRRWSPREYLFLKSERGDGSGKRGDIDLRATAGGTSGTVRVKDLSRYVLDLTKR